MNTFWTLTLTNACFEAEALSAGSSKHADRTETIITRVNVNESRLERAIRPPRVVSNSWRIALATARQIDSEGNGANGE